MKFNKSETFKKIEILTKEEEFSLIQILNRKFAVYLQGRFFRLKVTADQHAVYAIVTLLSQNEDFFYPVEARAAYKDQEIEAKEALFLMLDYIDIYFDEYFREQENTFLPIDWTVFPFEGVDIELKGQVRNKKTEDLADKIISGDINPNEVTL